MCEVPRTRIRLALNSPSNSLPRSIPNITAGLIYPWINEIFVVCSIPNFSSRRRGRSNRLCTIRRVPISKQSTFLTPGLRPNLEQTFGSAARCLTFYSFVPIRRAVAFTLCLGARRPRRATVWFCSSASTEWAPVSRLGRSGYKGHLARCYRNEFRNK
jgi:hypothetical protein